MTDNPSSSSSPAQANERFLIKNRFSNADVDTDATAKKTANTLSHTHSDTQSDSHLPEKPHDPRLHVPATLRNREPICDILCHYSALYRIEADQTGIQKPLILLELGSGSGEHGHYIAPRLPQGWLWQPSDPEIEHRASIDAWSQDHASGKRLPILPALALDIMAENWPVDKISCPIVFAANILHIAPIELVDNIMKGSARTLTSGGFLIIYGPFQEGATPLAPSNIAFDESLKARNGKWGIRNTDKIDQLAKAYGLTPHDRKAMPANNLCLIYQRP